MAKVITLSKAFPSYHPMKGKPTYFALKTWLSVNDLPDNPYKNVLEMIQDLNGGKFDMGQLKEFVLESASPQIVQPKHHTIRAAKRWKAGDKCSLRQWSDKPYNSPQIIIAPELMIARTIDFEMDLNGIYSLNGKYNVPADDWALAQNDGLTDIEMFHWFMKAYDKPKAFSGQVIIWNDCNLPY